jgi:hypothetical protein
VGKDEAGVSIILVCDEKADELRRDVIQGGIDHA